MSAVRTGRAPAIKCVIIALAATVLAAVGAVGLASTASAVAPSGGDGGIFVQDGANVLSSDTEDYIRRSNEKWEKDSKLPVQLLVVTADKTPDGKSIEDWSMSLAEKHKPGDKEKDTGLVYAVAVDDHKDRLEVGYGLEDKITDSMASQMIREAEASYKKGDYDAGVRALVKAVGDQLYGDGWTPSKGARHRLSLSDVFFGLVGILALIVVAVYFIGQIVCLIVQMVPDIPEFCALLLSPILDKINPSWWSGSSDSSWDSSDSFDDDSSDSSWGSSSSSSWSSSSSSWGDSSSSNDSFGGGSFGGGGASGSW